ncbi:MAG: [FeFe] hydrogenase H-cluster radical SAM maturase HydE [Massilioclostridium sp.]|nr:[FeFe] hydrogenase H-cluster radical SAM maturase HydE [Massilioclostridium coli]PWM98213.1 MAG: [FeFe] hydrogenase H-cluster radical SAM maturase HydE [Massilioclostridium sp.]
MERIHKIVAQLLKGEFPEKEGLKELLSFPTHPAWEVLKQAARHVRKRYYGTDVYIRGLIEFTNICKNDCYYCGIRKSNQKAERYRLTLKQVLSCCKTGYRLGFRTFVLQGGEDGYFTDEKLCLYVAQIRKRYPDCAITLSVGERSRESYQKLFDAGANRYLLRHETANSGHYAKLHPSELALKHRMQCLSDLKQIGFQTGCGFMVGSPFQTLDNLIEDLEFLVQFQPEMVGIGPFIPHCDTPFADEPAGTLEMTVNLLSIIRLLLPKVLLPATTALGTIDPNGRELGILAGANVVMPNLSPIAVRKKYLLYNNKISTGAEAAESLADLKQRMERIGYQVVTSRGDYPKE